MQCGLLGGKLGHSYSPQIHKMLAPYDYALYEREPEELEDFLEKGSFSGLNVTIPYKKAVVAFCSRLSPQAETLGSVNAIVRETDGSLSGYNTDYYGFQSMVARTGLYLQGKKALVLGSGGASVTAVAVLEELGAQVVVISRSGENHYGNLHLHSDAALIVNATPVGMYPRVGVAALSLDAFPRLEGVLDMVYNPARTALLLDAESRGLVAENGLWMLVAQAKQSAELFTKTVIADKKIAEIHGQLKAQMENIVLIGMPGSGKTTIGLALSQTLHRPFVDADEELVKAAGMTIPEIFAKEGEAGFRQRETETLAKLGCQSGLILSTGGGCVTQPRNLPLLHQNGTIFCLERELSKLPTQGRPLSQAGSLTAMYETRKPMYEAFQDFAIDNNGTTNETVAQILDALGGRI